MGANRSMFERHLQTAIQVVLVALILWSGSQLVQIGQQSAVLEERLTTQAEQLSELRRELKEWSDLFYRRTDAERELDQIESRIDNLDRRVSSLEGQ